MPRPSHRLDAVLVFPRELSADRLEDALTLAQRIGIVRGGYATARIDDLGREAFWGNHQGGFKVHCPHCEGPLAKAFSTSLSAWRGGAERKVTCEACGEVSDLASVPLSPPGAFGRCALVLCDVATLEWNESALGALKQLVGDWTVVLRRIG